METVSVPLVLAMITVTLFSAAGLSSCASTRGYTITGLDQNRPDFDTPNAPDVAELYQIYQLSINPWSTTGTAVAGTSIALFEDTVTDTVAAALWRNGTVLVVFRGTQNGRRGRVDRRQNMKIALEPILFEDDPTHQRRAHLGFQQKYLGVREPLREYLEHLSGVRVVFAGHSAGGALATLAYYDYVVVSADRDADEAGQRRSPAAELVTFGSPRVLNHQAAIALEHTAPPRSAFRVVNGNDIIPSVPSRIFGYRHVGTRVRIGTRSAWKPFSGHDHFPGYRIELEELLLADGRPARVDPDPSNWEFWSRANQDAP